MYDKKFASKEERLANLHIIVNHLASEVKYRPEIKNTLVHYMNLRDQVSMELEHMYCTRFNKPKQDETLTKSKILLNKLKEPKNVEVNPITSLINDNRLPNHLKNKLSKLQNEVIDLELELQWNPDANDRLSLAQVYLDEVLKQAKKYIK